MVNWRCLWPTIISYTIISCTVLVIKFRSFTKAYLPRIREDIITYIYTYINNLKDTFINCHLYQRIIFSMQTNLWDKLVLMPIVLWLVFSFQLIYKNKTKLNKCQKFLPKSLGSKYFKMKKLPVI